MSICALLIDEDRDNKKNTRIGWQPSSRKQASKSAVQKSSSRLSNRIDEELQSGYDTDDHDPDPLRNDPRHTEDDLDKRQETRITRSRKTKAEKQEEIARPKSLSKPTNQAEDTEEEEDETIEGLISRSRKTKRDQQHRKARPKPLSKKTNQAENMENDDVETNEVLNLRRFCQVNIVGIKNVLIK